MGILPIPRTLSIAFKCKKSKKRQPETKRFQLPLFRMPSQITYALKRPPYSPQWHIRQPILLTIVGHREAHAVQT